MKRTIIIIIISLLSITVYSQKDPAAKAILDKLSEITKSHPSIQVDFKIDYKNIKDNMFNTSEGSITMKGDKYYLRFMGVETFFDGKTQWNYIKDVNEVNIIEPEPNDDDIFNNPKRLFTIYENDFKYQHINDIVENKVNYSIIDLYPENMDEDFSRIRLQINTDKYFLSSATIFGKDGSHYSITINKYNTSVKTQESVFIFNEAKYPGVEIIDMR